MNDTDFADATENNYRNSGVSREEWQEVQEEAARWFAETAGNPLE